MVSGVNNIYCNSGESQDSETDYVVMTNSLQQLQGQKWNSFTSLQPCEFR